MILGSSAGLGISAEVSIYDATGREVEQLNIAEVANKDGIKFRPDSHSSGVYYYIIRIGGHLYRGEFMKY